MLPVQVRNRPVRSSWDPLREIDRFFNGWDQTPEDGVLGAYPVDVREDESHIYVDAELPGFTKDQIEITLENGVLTIQAERKPEETSQQKHLTERRYTKVARRFNIPNLVDETNVEAKLADGVLHITLNKREEVKPRKIAVK